MSAPIMSTHTPPNFECTPEGTFLKILHSIGFRLTKLDTTVSAFIQFAILQKEWVLDVGCAFGIATIPIVMSGGRVIANDLNEGFLESLKGKIPPHRTEHLRLSKAVFPDHLQITDSLAAIRIAHGFHFFTEAKIEQALSLCFHWLKPNGKIFVSCEASKFEMMIRSLSNAGFLIEKHDLPAQNLTPSSENFGIIGQKSQ